jgi:membrane carboxypeptidase/penicillin-binding protein
VKRPYMVRAVRDADGLVLWSQTPESERITSEQAAFLATDLGVEVLRSGTATGARHHGVTEGAGGKTGTTDKGTDAWFAGYTKDIAVVVWVGFDQGRPLGLSGAAAALPTWARFVAGSGTARGSFTPPAGLVQVTVCAESGQRASDRCPQSGPEWFQEGHEPEQGPCPIHSGLVENAAAAATDVVEEAWGGIKGIFRKKDRGRDKEIEGD